MPADSRGQSARVQECKSVECKNQSTSGRGRQRALEVLIFFVTRMMRPRVSLGSRNDIHPIFIKIYDQSDSNASIQPPPFTFILELYLTESKRL